MPNFIRQSSRFFSTQWKSQTLTHPYASWAADRLSLIPTQFHIRMVQTDGAGTVFDPFCLASFHAISTIFSKRGLTLTPGQIAPSMGLDTLSHIKNLLLTHRKEWERINKKPMELPEAESLNEEFITTLHSTVKEFAQPIYGVNEAHSFLQNQAIPLALTSEYPRHILGAFLHQTRNLPRFNSITASDEVVDRESANMIFANMKKLKLNITSMSRMIYISNSCSNIKKISNLVNPPWVFGVGAYGPNVEIASKHELSTIPQHELDAKRGLANNKLLAAGANLVMDNLSQLPLALLAASEALQRGVGPSTKVRLTMGYPQLTPSFNNYNLSYLG